MTSVPILGAMVSRGNKPLLTEAEKPAGPISQYGIICGICNWKTQKIEAFYQHRDLHYGGFHAALSFTHRANCTSSSSEPERNKDSGLERNHSSGNHDKQLAVSQNRATVLGSAGC